MKRPSRSMVACCSAIITAAVLAGCGPVGYKNEQSGSEEAMKKVEQGQPFYQPPAGAPVPGAPGYGGGAPGGAPGGMPTSPPGPPGGGQ